MTRREHLLVRLSEECSEVIKEVSKILIFGMDDIPPEKKLEPNSKRLTQEIVDVFALIDMLKEDGFPMEVLDSEESMETAMQQKRDKVEHYLEYSREKGLLR